MFADEIRRQAEAAPRAALPAVTAALWRAYGEGKVTEAEAEALSALIEARRIMQNACPPAPTVNISGHSGNVDPPLRRISGAP